MTKLEHRHMFYSAETSIQYARAKFEGETDEEKMDVFNFHEVKWTHYRDEIRVFTHSNWTRWKTENPEWLTEKLIQRVPDEFIPVPALAELNAANGGKRRRSSLGLASLLQESGRDSVRRDSASSSSD
jgi:hypothetical protein